MIGPIYQHRVLVMQTWLLAIQPRAIDVVARCVLPGCLWLPNHLPLVANHWLVSTILVGEKAAFVGHHRIRVAAVLVLRGKTTDHRPFAHMQGQLAVAGLHVTVQSGEWLNENPGLCHVDQPLLSHVNKVLNGLMVFV